MKQVYPWSQTFWTTRFMVARATSHLDVGSIKWEVQGRRLAIVAVDVKNLIWDQVREDLASKEAS